MTGGVSLSKAQLYESHRLPYAPEAAADLLERLGTPRLVADVGAGTGQLARLLAGRCEGVVAIEPELAMCVVAVQSLAHLPAVDIVAGTAEGIPLGADCVDLVVIGNAYHRFRPEACDELRRILAPGGHIALFSYEMHSRELTDMLFGKLAALTGLASRVEAAFRRLPAEALFGSARLGALVYPQQCRENWETFFGAACAGVEAPEPGDPEFARFEQINREVFDTFAADGWLTMEYETRVAFARPSL